MRHWFEGLIFAAAVTGGAMLLTALLQHAADVGAQGGPGFVPTSSVRLWLDPETGCEYFAEGYRPRLDATGKQICNADGVTK